MRVLSLCLFVGLVGCGGASASDQSPPGTTPVGATPPTAITTPPTGTSFDYQLGGAYAPPSGVGIVSRDRTAAPSGLYDICYINGFQAQTAELDWWQTNHPDALLRDSSGKLVMDTEWNEAIFDVRTDATRTTIADVIGSWVDGCAAGGYDAVEMDNLDSYSRSNGLMTSDEAIAMMQAFSTRAHADHLAIAQKNSADLVADKSTLGTDFVTVEECAHYDECDTYTGGYGSLVLEIEYDKADFDKACAASHSHPIILRDRNLVPAGSSGYVYDAC